MFATLRSIHRRGVSSLINAQMTNAVRNSKLFLSSDDAPQHWYIKMPHISEEEKFGKVLKWRKKEGEKVSTGECLCEVEFNDFSINLTMEEDSFVAKILVSSGDDRVPVETPLCALVPTEEDVEKYQAEHSQKQLDSGFGFKSKDIMMVIMHALKMNLISEELATHMLFLARQKSLELSKAFDGSFQEEKFEEKGLDGFDIDLFLLQAKDIVKSQFPLAKIS